MDTRVIAVGFNTGPTGGDDNAVAAQLDRMLALGADGCELSASALDAVAACRLVPARVKALRAITRARPLSYSMHAPIPINLMNRTEPDLHRRAAAVSLELAAELGARDVVLHPGRARPEVWAHEADSLLAAERDVLADLAERALALGVRIAYENISPNPAVMAGAETSYSLDPTALARQIAAVGHPGLVACLDVSHAQQGAGLMGFDMIAACATLGPHIGHFHFSDSTGVPMRTPLKSEQEKTWFGVGDMHAPPGWGTIDFDALADALDVLPGCRMVIELKRNFHAHAAADTLAAARAFGARLNRGRA